MNVTGPECVHGERNRIVHSRSSRSSSSSSSVDGRGGEFKRGKRKFGDVSSNAMFGVF